jgi:hypothetical protein
MSIVLFVLGAVVLGYWILSIKEPHYNRPRIIWEHGGKILALGLALVAAGFFI